MVFWFPPFSHRQRWLREQVEAAALPPSHPHVWSSLECGWEKASRGVGAAFTKKLAWGARADDTARRREKRGCCRRAGSGVLEPQAPPLLPWRRGAVGPQEQGPISGRPQGQAGRTEAWGPGAPGGDVPGPCAM